jgi:O-Antigen ligase
MPTDLALAVGACGLAVAATRRPGWPVLALIVLLGTIILIPKALSHEPDPNHVGIARSVPTLATYSLAVFGIGYALLLRVLYRPRARSVPISVFVFFGFLVVGFTTIWRGTDEQLAGALQLGLGFCAWFVGAQLGPSILCQARRIRWIAGMIVGLVGIETLVTLLQRAGIHIYPMAPALAAIMGDRTNGTTNHPDNLGKILLLLLILSLALMGTTDARARRMLWVAVVLMFIPLGLSQGRANILAALTTVIFWALLSGRRRSRAIRIGVPLVVVLVFLPFAGSVAKRIEEDPYGGPRAGLAATAYEQIARQPWGVGPNSYVSVVSAYNSVTAEGYPVHNSFLLTAAEFGVLGAILFWLPVVGLLILAVKSRKRRGFAGSFAIVILASAPGLYVVTITGWAMLSNQLFPFWFLVYGMAYSQFVSSSWLRVRRTTTGPSASTPRVASTPTGLGQAFMPSRG